MTDVLMYWSPDIDWSFFNKQEFDERTWYEFQDFIKLCHAVVHWGNLHKSAERDRRYTSDPSIKRQYVKQIQKYDTHHGRARFLAAESAYKILSIGHDIWKENGGS